MRAGSSLSVSAPSSSLLRFLRSQSDKICFFTSSRSATSCQNSQPRGSWTISRSARQCLLRFTRRLTTSSNMRANVESSIRNFDILRLPSKHRPSPHNIPTYEPASRNGPFPNNRRTLFSRLWKQKDRLEKVNLGFTDRPPLHDFLNDIGGASLNRNRPGKLANELKLRCTEFDSQGKVTFMDGEFKKTELIAKVRTP